MTTDLDQIDKIRSLKAKSWIMCVEPSPIQSELDWQRRVVPIGTKARIRFHGGGTFCELETGEPIVIEKHDLAKWDTPDGS